MRGPRSLWLRWHLSDAPDVPADLAYVMDQHRHLLRVDGDALCPTCHERYGDHPSVHVRGFESFYKGCGGIILKT